MCRTRAIMIAAIALFTIVSCQSVGAKTDAPPEPVRKAARLTVPDANCASTGAEADQILRGIDGVTSVDIDIDLATADISYDSSKTSIERIKAVLESGGYPVTKVEKLE